MPYYPNDARLGAGLHGFYLSDLREEPTLIIAKRQKSNPVPPPGSARFVSIRFVDMAISDHSGPTRLIALLIKFLGYAMFSLQSIPLILRFRPDIVHIHTPMPIIHGLFAKYVLGSKLFITFHGTDVRHMPRSRVLRALVRRADAVCYVSRSMRPIFEGAVPAERLLYTPNGVDTGAFPVGDGDRARTVLMVGSLRWQKGYADALNAFALFRSTNPDWRLNIVGWGPQREELELQIRQSGLDGSVDFIDVAERVEVAKLMRESRLFMLSSVSEGFPKVLLETAASALPTVATDVGSCREVVEKGVGLVVPPGDPEALASALNTLATDEKLWEECSRRGPMVAKEYSWESTVEVVYEAYRRALAD